MKILVQTLKKIPNENLYIVDETLTEEIQSKNINEAKERATKLKNERSPHKIRVIEYHNNESDEIRQPCKILFED